MSSRTTIAPAAAVPASPKVRPMGGIAVGVALVLLAVLAGMVGQRAAGGGTTASGGAADGAGAAVPATGHTTTVEVSAVGMRYRPDRISVPAGNRLVIVFTNTDSRRHDLVLANGARTGLLSRGDSERLDAGVIGGTVRGWCTQPAHRQSGMTLTITATGDAPAAEHPAGSAADGSASSTGSARVDAMADPGPGFAAHDAAAPVLLTGRVHRVTLHAQEVQRDVAAGVSQTLWTFNGTAPRPVLRGRVGDTFEITLINDAAVEHGIDFHAEALAPETAMRAIEPGESIVYRFTAVRAGIWMYHCSAMPTLYHVGNGMYGALIVDPPGLAAADREYVLVQSEFYLGAQGQPGDAAKMAADQPDAVVFNGYVSQYAFRPLAAHTGERVRLWVLNAGPNRSSAFHVIGAPFDTVYAEGGYLLRPPDPGGAQVLDLAPAAGGFVELAFTEPGTYPFLSHALADADRGARGAIQVTDAPQAPAR